MRRKDIDAILDDIEEIFDWLEELSYDIYRLKRGRSTDDSQNTYRPGSAMSFIEQIYGQDINFDGSESGIKMTSWSLLDDIIEERLEDDTDRVKIPVLGDERWEADAWNVYATLYDILVKKQKDYGPDNIRKAPGGPLNGLSVRLHDKIARLSNLLETGATPENESLRDTFVDIANYGVIGVMLLDDTFPKSKDA